MADTTYPTSPYHRADGNLVVPSGAALVVESGGTLTVDGNSITTTEFNLLDTAVAGTVVASKAAIYDTAGKLYMSSASPARSRLTGSPSFLANFPSSGSR